MRILLVEDDAMIGQAIVCALQDEAYAVDWVQDGGMVIAALKTQDYDGVLLDLNLPTQDGLSVLRQLRNSKNAIPVLILTAREGIDERVKGLDLGADDYLVKPFDLQEMLARLRAIIRRQCNQMDSVITNGVLTLNPATHEAQYGTTVSTLSPKEYALLRVLLLRAGSIFSRSALESKIYGWDEEVNSNTIEVPVHNIRKKLGTDVIKNVRRVGWIVDKNAQITP